jgi:hypothetical protein
MRLFYRNCKSFSNKLTTNWANARRECHLLDCQSDSMRGSHNERSRRNAPAERPKQNIDQEQDCILVVRQGQQQCSDPCGHLHQRITRPTLEAKAINVILIATIQWLGPA